MIQKTENKSVQSEKGNKSLSHRMVHSSFNAPLSLNRGKISMRKKTVVLNISSKITFMLPQCMSF